MCRLYAAQRSSFLLLQRSTRWSITARDAESINKIGTGVCGARSNVLCLAAEQHRAGSVARTRSDTSRFRPQHCFPATARLQIDRHRARSSKAALAGRLHSECKAARVLLLRSNDGHDRKSPRPQASADEVSRIVRAAARMSRTRADAHLAERSIDARAACSIHVKAEHLQTTGIRYRVR